MNYKLYYLLILLLFIFSCVKEKSNYEKKNENIPAITQVQEDTLYNRVADNLKIIESNINNITDMQLISFLDAYKSEFENNAEVTEWRNELLFILSQKYPSNLIAAIDKSTTYQKDIFSDYENPIHDGIDLKNTYRKIKNNSVQCSTKDSILNHLSKALKKVY